MSDDNAAELLEQKVLALKELLFQRLDANDTALILQAEEIHRRLNELNHAHEQARQKEVTFVPRESWEAFAKEYERWKQALLAEQALLVNRDMLETRIALVSARLDEALASLSGRLENIERQAANMQGRLWMLGATLSALVIAVNWFMRYLGK